MKKAYLECLRVIAIIFVIYNHTRTLGYELFTVTTESLSYWFSYIFYPLCKMAVPIFLMISGVNLLDKQESLRVLFRKRVLKHICILALFGTLQFFRYVRTGKAVLSLSAWFSSIYCQPILETYWFLYLYLGFLLILPLLRKMNASMDKSDFLYIFVLYNIFNILIVVGYFSGYFINAHIFNLSNIIFYPIIGYGIDKYGQAIKLHICLLTTMIVQGITAILGLLYIRYYPDNFSGFTSMIQFGTPIMASGLFLTAKMLCKNRENKIICSIGSTVFGIYLIEDIVRNQIEKVIVKSDLVNKINDFVVAILFVISTFVCSMIIIYMIKLILLLFRKKSKKNLYT